MRCYLIYCVLVIDLVWAHVDLVQIGFKCVTADSVWFVSMLVWLYLIRGDLILFESSVIDSVRFNVNRRELILFDSDSIRCYWIHVDSIWFLSIRHLLVCLYTLAYSTWFDSSDLMWFGSICFGPIWDHLVSCGLIRFDSIWLGVAWCALIWCDAISCDPIWLLLLWLNVIQSWFDTFDSTLSGSTWCNQLFCLTR